MLVAPPGKPLKDDVTGGTSELVAEYVYSVLTGCADSSLSTGEKIRSALASYTAFEVAYRIAL